MKRDSSHYVMTATKNGQTVTLTFDNREVYFDAEDELRRQGFAVDAPSHGYTTCRSVESALHIANTACRT